MITKSTLELSIRSEFGKLRKVIVKDPNGLSFSRLEESTSDMQDYNREKRYHPEDQEFDAEVIIEQLKQFQRVLEENDVILEYVDNIPNARYQFFTRDLAFVVGDTLYVSRMFNESRKIEQNGLNNIRRRLPLSKYITINRGTVEGGDILVNSNSVYIGLTRRSSREGFDALRFLVEKQGYHCVAVPCKNSVLHLDCRFNIISPQTALIYGNDILPEGIETIKSSFKGEIIYLPETEIKTLGPNFFMISPNLAVVEKRNTLTLETLSDKGYSVIPLDFSEVNKLWGSFRCTTLPLYRE